MVPTRTHIPNPDPDQLPTLTQHTTQHRPDDRTEPAEPTNKRIRRAPTQRLPTLIAAALLLTACGNMNTTGPAPDTVPTTPETTTTTPTQESVTYTGCSDLVTEIVELSENYQPAGTVTIIKIYDPTPTTQTSTELVCAGTALTSDNTTRNEHIPVEFYISVDHHNDTIIGHKLSSQTTWTTHLLRTGGNPKTIIIPNPAAGTEPTERPAAATTVPDTTRTTFTTTTSTTLPEPVGTIRNPVPAGHTTQISGWEWSILGFDDALTTRIYPDLGYGNSRAVLIWVETELTDPQPAGTPIWYLTLYDSGNNSYTPDPECWWQNTSATDLYQGGEYYPGGIVSGWVCYVVPEDADGPWTASANPNGTRSPTYFAVPDQTRLVRDPKPLPTDPENRDSSSAPGTYQNPHPVGQPASHNGWSITVTDIRTKPDPKTERAFVYATLKVENHTTQPSPIPFVGFMSWGGFDSVGTSGQVMNYPHHGDMYPLLGFEYWCDEPDRMLDIHTALEPGETTVGDVCWSVHPTDVQHLTMRVTQQTEDGTVLLDDATFFETNHNPQN